jgi:ABC-type lipoprotein export system ATPase subunit
LSVIVAAHDPTIVELADRVIQLRDGAVVAGELAGAGRAG